jgi:hypothetical protein
MARRNIRSKIEEFVKLSLEKCQGEDFDLDEKCIQQDLKDILKEIKLVKNAETNVGISSYLDREVIRSLKNMDLVEVDTKDDGSFVKSSVIAKRDGPKLTSPTIPLKMILAQKYKIKPSKITFLMDRVGAAAKASLDDDEDNVKNVIKKIMKKKVKEEKKKKNKPTPEEKEKIEADTKAKAEVEQKKAEEKIKKKKEKDEADKKKEEEKKKKKEEDLKKKEEEKAKKRVETKEKELKKAEEKHEHAIKKGKAPPISLNVHDYDGKWSPEIIKYIKETEPKSTFLEFSNGMQDKIHASKKKDSEKKALLDTFRQLVTKRDENVDPANKVHCEKIVCLLWDKVKDCNCTDELLFEQINDLNSGFCAQGRTTRFGNVLYSIKNREAEKKSQHEAELKKKEEKEKAKKEKKQKKEKEPVEKK